MYGLTEENHQRNNTHKTDVAQGDNYTLINS